jgi:hypothetical protein
MTLYELEVQKDLARFKKKIDAKSNIFTKISQGAQEQFRKLVPKKLQDAVTAAFEKFITIFIAGTEMFGFKENTEGMTLSERDYLVLKEFEKYSKKAVFEGAATGAAGFFVGLADLPALLGIKIAFLARASKLYGYNPDSPSERLFILYVFQLAFSGTKHQQYCYETIQNWDNESVHELDWERLQVEYRDYLDIAKMLQMVPYIGSSIGAIANEKLMKQLLDCTMNSYRMRLLRREYDNKKGYKND